MPSACARARSVGFLRIVPLGHTAREILRVRRIALDEGRRITVAGGIEHLAWIAVAGHEALQTDHVGMGFGTDQDRAACARLDQHDAPENERPHDPVAQCGFGDHQGPQVFGRNEQRLHTVNGMNIDQRWPA